MEIPDELIDQLLGDYQGPEQLTGPDGLINQLRKRLIERAAGASSSSISATRRARSRRVGRRIDAMVSPRRRCVPSTGRSRSSCRATVTRASSTASPNKPAPERNRSSNPSPHSRQPPASCSHPNKHEPPPPTPCTKPKRSGSPQPA